MEYRIQNIFYSQNGILYIDRPIKTLCVIHRVFEVVEKTLWFFI